MRALIFFKYFMALPRFHIVRTELQKTRELGDQLLSWAKRHRDAVLSLSAHQLIGTALWFMGNFGSSARAVRARHLLL